MKILQINSVYGVGSTGRIVAEINKLLLKKNYDGTVIYGRGPTSEESNLIKIGSDFNNYKHVIKTRIFDRHGFSSVKETKQLIKEIQKIKPDIIHLHNIHGYYVNIEILFNFLKQHEFKVVWTFHDCWPFTGHCAYFDYAGCMKWITQCESCPQLNSYPRSSLVDNSFKNYNDKKRIFSGLDNMTIVTPSNWLKEVIKKSFLKDYPIEVINNGIDLSIFKPQEKKNFKLKEGLAEKFIILGVASVWDERKGLKYFLELSKFIKEDEVIVLVGLNKKQLKNLPNNIIGISRTNNIQELADLYSSANVFVNPTLEDNFPTTNLESLGCGTPVITFETGGSIESIDSSCGFVVEKGDLEGLLSKIEYVKELGEDNELRINARKRAMEFYSSSERNNDYITLYKEILG